MFSFKKLKDIHDYGFDENTGNQLLEDLTKYVPTFHTTLIETKMFNPIHEYTQLSYVLPKNSLHLLPKSIQNLLLKKFPDLHSDNCKIIWHFCRYFWESHVELNHIDINQLNTLVKSQI